MLEKLDPEILPALTKCYRADSGAPADHFAHIQQRWTKELEFLCYTIDEISDSLVFVEVTG